MQTRKDCPQFNGWIAIGLDEHFMRGDKLCYIGARAVEQQRHLTPEKGYDLWNGGYDNGNFLSYWSRNSSFGMAIYRKKTSPDDPYVSRCSPIPMNYNYATALPLP